MAASGTLVIRFIGDLKEFERATAAMGARLRTTGKSLTTGLTLPIVAAGAAATKLAMDFEDSMSKIVGLVGVSKQEVQHFSDVILRDGPKWGKAPKELADALFFVTSAGFRGKEALDILKTSAKASSAGLGDTMIVADLLTSAMNAYGDGNLSAAHSADVLTKAVQLGKMASTDLAGAMPKILPLASALGVSFDESAAAIASMSRQGTNAATGATQLRGIMAALLKPTAAADETLHSMGLSAGGLRQELKDKGLLDTLETLKTKFHGNTAETAKVFGNVRALTGVMSLMGGNVDQTRDIFDKMTHSSGAMKFAFDEASTTTQFKLDKAMAQLKATLIKVGIVLLPIVAAALDRLSGFLATAGKAWDGLSDNSQHFILAALGIAAAVGPVLMILGRLLLIVSAFASPVGLVVLGVLLLAAAFAAIAIKAHGLEGGLQSLMAPFTSGGFVTAIKSLGAAFMAFGAQLLPTLKQIGSEIMAALGPALSSIADVIATKLVPAFQAILPIIEPVAAFLLKMFGAALVGVIKGAADVIVGFVTVISGVFQLIAALVHGDWKAAWDAVKQIVSGAIQAVWGALQVWLNIGILGLFKQGGKLILASWKGLWDLVKGGVEAAFKALDGVVARGISSIVGFLKGLPGKAVSALSDLARSLSSDAERALSSMGTAVSVGIIKVTEFFRGLPGKAVSALGDLGSTLLGKGKALIAGLLHGITNGATAVWSWLRGIPGKVTGAVGDLDSILANAGRAVIQGLLDGITEKWHEVQSLVSGMGSWIAAHKGPEDKDRKLLTPAGIAIMKGLLDGLTSGTPAVKSYLDQLTSQIHKALDKRYDGKALRNHQAAVMKSLSDEFAAVERVGKAYAKWKDKLEAAKTKLQEIKDYVGGIADQFRDFGNVVGTGGRTETIRVPDVDASGNPMLDENGNQTYTEQQREVAATAQTIIEDLQAKAAQAQEFKTQIANLAAAGLNDTTIQQLLAAGVESGLATAQAIAAGGTGAITQINALTDQITTAGVDTGNIAAREFFGAGIQAAQGLVDGLKAKEPEIEAIANRLAHRLARAIRHALRIESPSKVFAEIGALTAAGLVQGMLDGSRDVMRAGEHLARMTVVMPTDRHGLATYAARPASFAAASTGGGYDGPPVVFQQHFPTNADPRAAAEAAAGRIVAALGV